MRETYTASRALPARNPPPALCGGLTPRRLHTERGRVHTGTKGQVACSTAPPGPPAPRILRPAWVLPRAPHQRPRRELTGARCHSHSPASQRRRPPRVSKGQTTLGDKAQPGRPGGHGEHGERSSLCVCKALTDLGACPASLGRGSRPVQARVLRPVRADARGAGRAGHVGSAGDPTAGSCGVCEGGALVEWGTGVPVATAAEALAPALPRRLESGLHFGVRSRPPQAPPAALGPLSSPATCSRTQPSPPCWGPASPSRDCRLRPREAREKVPPGGSALGRIARLPG